jgi:penicillin-binding protein 2
MGLLLLLLLGIRLYKVQIVDGTRYAGIAQNQRRRRLPIPAPRGIIFDRNGHPLVDSRPIYNVILTREDLQGRKLDELVQPLADGLQVDKD